MKRLKHILEALDTVTLFEENPIPMWISRERDQVIISVNKAAVSIYGYPDEEFIGMLVVDLYPPADQKLFELMVAENSGEIPKPGIWRHLKADGSILNIETRYQPIQQAGEECLLLVMALPIDRKVDLSVIKKYRNMGMYGFLKKADPTEEEINWLKKIYDYVLSRLNEPISLDELSRHLAQSPRTLNRTCNALTGHSPSQLVQRIKFGRVRLYFEAGLVKDAGKMAQLIGYSDPFYFAQKFQEMFGKSLLE